MKSGWGTWRALNEFVRFYFLNWEMAKIFLLYYLYLLVFWKNHTFKSYSVTKMIKEKSCSSPLEHITFFWSWLWLSFWELNFRWNNADSSEDPILEECEAVSNLQSVVYSTTQKLSMDSTPLPSAWSQCSKDTDFQNKARFRFNSTLATFWP